MKATETRKAELFDTSLRDGMQQPNLDISVPNAAGLLERMAAFGVQYAEVGFAGANKFVTELATALPQADTGAMKLALFGRTRGRGARVEDWPDVQFMAAHKKRIPVAVIVVKSRLRGFDIVLEHAAMDLGARGPRVFRLITLPLILPAVITAWLLTHTAFTLRYAHLYYRDDQYGVGGLQFPGERPPDEAQSSCAHGSPNATDV